MIISKIRSEGLAHLSYMLVSEDEAAVIDPRRDVDVYIDAAARQGLRIKYVFETHRNEDYVSGALELSKRAGSVVLHGKAMDFKYGLPVSEGDSFALGEAELLVLETPGHTFESISLVLKDRETSGAVTGVFTGDALFAGDVGRTDFFPGREEETAGLLYDSIINKILPLGDGVILYPAHGAGSLCGADMSAREGSTLGIEREYNPLLGKSREDFIRHKSEESHYLPPYFKRMEEYNLNGPPPIRDLPEAVPIPSEEFHERMKWGMVVLDARSPESYAGVHIPGSLSIPVDMIPAFAGWILPADSDIGLIVEDPAMLEQARAHLFRIGCDAASYVLSGGIGGWELSGERFGSIPAVHVDELMRRIGEKDEFTLLDVRTSAEFKEAHLPGAVNIYAGELPEKIGMVPRGKPVVTFCGSGRRAVIAASVLRKNGFSEVENCFGSMGACMSTACGGLAVE